MDNFNQFLPFTRWQLAFEISHQVLQDMGVLSHGGFQHAGMTIYRDLILYLVEVQQSILHAHLKRLCKRLNRPLLHHAQLQHLSHYSVFFTSNSIPKEPHVCHYFSSSRPCTYDRYIMGNIRIFEGRSHSFIFSLPTLILCLENIPPANNTH